MKQAIHQFVAGYSRGDAISNEARVLRDIFRGWGHESQIFCDPDRILPELKKDCFDVRSAPEKIEANDIVLHHLSIGCQGNRIFKEIHCRKALLYHNITPAEHFAFINLEIAGQLEQGRKQMKELAGVAEVNLADSRYNADELQELHYGPSEVLPLVLDLSMLDGKSSPLVKPFYANGKKTVLFVGRCAPNKAIEDLLHAFHYFQKYVEPNSQLIHVGSAAGVEEYLAMMKARSKELGLHDVLFAGPIPQDQLNAHYEMADLFLCMSEHEGFGIPLIEAMYKGLPVLAYDCTAVGDTMGGAGVLTKEKHWDEIAEMMGQLIHNQSLRTSVISEQNERIKRYTTRDLEQELKNHLSPLIES